MNEIKLTDKFENYKDDYSKLVDKYVLYESGQSYDSNRRRSIVKITKITKTGFRITGEDSKLFDFYGHQKGLSKDRYNWSVISRCELLTESEKDEIVKIWKEKKEKKALFEDIQKLLTIDLSTDKLQEINKIIKG